jgi:ribonuclease HI
MPIPGFITYPVLNRSRAREWVAVYHAPTGQSILGRIQKKDIVTNSIVVQHWLHFIDNVQVSPSYLKSIVYPCPGCSIHDSRYASISRSKHSPSVLMCGASFPFATAIAVSKCRKVTQDRYILSPSLFELQQMAKRQFDVFTNPIFVPLPMPTSTVGNDPVLKHISSIVTRNKLASFKDSFSLSQTLTFYTDGSLINSRSDLCCMGIGWVQVDSDGSSAAFSAQVERFPSSLRAELYSVLSAICTAPQFCLVNLFTDNSNVAAGLDFILSGSLVLPSHLRSIFNRNHLLWAAIKYVITSNDLMLSTSVVKAHSNNKFNDLADQAAKAGLTAPVLDFDTSFLSHNDHVLTWSGITVDCNSRHFTKELLKAKNFNSIFNSSRMDRVNRLSRHELIDWSSTGSLLSYHNSTLGTSFSTSALKTFQVKCFTRELPTMAQLKRNRPDLYKSSYRCASCGSLDEDFDHIWLCTSRRPVLHECIELLTQTLQLSVESLLKCTLTASQLNALVSHSCWSLTPVEYGIQLIDLIQGLIPVSLVNFLQLCGCTSAQAQSIITESFVLFQGLLLKHIWRPRCVDLLQFENVHGISQQMKTSGLPSGYSTSRNSASADVPSLRSRASLKSSNVTNEEWFLWHNYVCHYGGECTDF